MPSEETLARFDEDIGSLVAILATNPSFQDVVGRCGEILETYSGNSYALEHVLFRDDDRWGETGGMERSWRNARIPAGAAEMLGFDGRQKDAFVRLLLSLCQVCFEEDEDDQKELSKACRKYLLRRGATNLPRSDSETGVSLFDVATFLDPDDQEAARDTVRRMVKSKKIHATVIGKDPQDGRAQIYRLAELLKDVEKIYSLKGNEKSRLETHLRSRQRSPP